MDILEIMKARHSVRQYLDKKIEEEKRVQLAQLVEACNQESGLHIQLLFDEEKCFDSMMAHYGRLIGVKNYIALVGKKNNELDEKCGYYGEKVVLKAQELGLNTCWVALTYGKGKCAAKVADDEKLVCVIALGYGANQGVPHKNKPWEVLCDYRGEAPEWFQKGMEAAMLAPTAVNQQKFVVSLKCSDVKIRAKRGFCTKLDLGIVKCHFEMASGVKVARS